MFASQAKKLKFDIENGQQVLIRASVSVYEASGQYQLYVQSIEPDGIGQLYIQFVALKDKLAKEGLFDECYKKDIPSFLEALLSYQQNKGQQFKMLLERFI